MADLWFRAPDRGTLRAELDALMDACGAPRFVTAAGLLNGALLKFGIRFDVDLIDDLVSVPPVVDYSSGLGVIVTPAITRGFHANLRITVHDPAPGVVSALQDFRANAQAYIAALPNVLDVLPAGVIAAYGVSAKSYRTTGAGVVYMTSSPAVPKRVFA